MPAIASGPWRGTGECRYASAAHRYIGILGGSMNSTMWKIALRTLARDKTYALLNVAGLALAIACCLILGRLSAQRAHVRPAATTNHDRIFRVVNEFEINGKLDRFAATSPMLGPMLKDDNADVQAFVRFLPSGAQRFIQYGDQGQYWSNVYVTDPNIFDVFTHKIIYGDPKTALEGFTSAAISRTLAERYFGDRNPIGEVLVRRRQRPRRSRSCSRTCPRTRTSSTTCCTRRTTRLVVDARGRQRAPAAAVQRWLVHVSLDAARLRPAKLGRGVEDVLRPAHDGDRQPHQRASGAAGCSRSTRYTCTPTCRRICPWATATTSTASLR